MTTLCISTSSNEINLIKAFVLVGVTPIALEYVIDPLALINVAVRKRKGTPTPSVVFFPFSSVLNEGSDVSASNNRRTCEARETQFTYGLMFKIAPYASLRGLPNKIRKHQYTRHSHSVQLL
jgi:hypothetical protein